MDLYSFTIGVAKKKIMTNPFLEVTPVLTLQQSTEGLKHGKRQGAEQIWGEIPVETPRIYVSKFEGDPNVQEALVGNYIQKCCLNYGDLVKFSYNAPETETGSTVEPCTSNTLKQWWKLQQIFHSMKRYKHIMQLSKVILKEMIGKCLMISLTSQRIKV